MSNNISVFGTLKDASFGGTDLSTKEFYCLDFIKGLMPPQSQSTFNVPEIPGLIQVSKKFDPYIIMAKGFLEGSNYSDLLDKLDGLASFLYNDNDQQLILSTKTDRYFMAQYLDYVEIEEKKDYSIFGLNFTCNDPFAYDTTPDTDLQSSVIVDDATFSISNGGHYYVWPVITITFNQAMSHIYIENTSITDNRFDVSKSFVATDELEIDCKNKTIKLNGAHSPAGFGDGGDELAEWILLAKGSNTMKVGTTDASIDVDVDMSWRKVYLS